MLNRENADGAAMSDTVLKVIAKFGERAFEKVVDAAVQAICESMVQDASNNPNAPGPYRRFKAWLAGPSPIQQQMRDALGQTFALYLQSEHGQVAQMLLDADFFKLPDVGAELQKALYPGQKVNIDKLAESWQQIWRPEYGNNIDKHRATEALNFIVDELRRAIRMQPLLQAFVTNTLTEEMLEVAQRQLDAQLEQRDLQRQQLVEQKRGNQLLEKLAIGSSSKDQQAIEETEAPPTGGSSAIMARFADDIPNRGETFIGRDDIMQRIEVRFTAKRKRSHLLLQGFSGMGKTTIAAQYAAQWIERQQGSVLWVEANAAPSDVLLESVAGAFNQDARQSVAKEVTPTGKGNVIRQHLRQVSLLVIDNAWDGNALFDLLNATPDELPVLITARQIYSIKTGDIIPVEELAADSALAILSYHAGKTLAPEAEARAICKTLGYLPFALEIAGKLLRDQSLAELSKSLDRAHELEMPLGFTQKGRESVVALLRTSIESLPEDTRMVLITCGAFFAPRITAEMLALYSPNIDTGAARTNLVFHGLLKRLDATPEAVASYRLHDLTFSYLQTLNDDTSHQRALEACLAYLERYSEPSLTNFAALRPELDGLLAAAAWASRNGQEQAVEDFAWGLYTGPNGEDRFLVRQGRYAQAIQLLTQATATSERAGNKDTQGAHLCNLGIAYYRIGQAGRAIRYYEQSLEISREIGDRRGEGASFGNLGNAYAELGLVKRAIGYHKQSLEIYREIGDRRGEGTSFGNLGNAYSNLGQVERAIGYHKQSLEINREIGNQRGESADLNNLGIAYADLGQVECAIDYFKQSLEISREISDRRGEGNGLRNFGFMYERNFKDYPKALDYYQQALVIWREIGATHLVVLVEAYIAIVRRKMGG